MMKFAASLTVTGVIGFLIMEALKILLAPVAAWLLTFVIAAVKIALIVAGIGVALLVLVLGIWAYRRFRKPAEAAE
jgi:hypothetical protein